VGTHCRQVSHPARGARGTPRSATDHAVARAADRVGPIHFAGADYAPKWPGYMDGAIRSGDATAHDVLQTP